MKLALNDGKVATRILFVHWPNQATVPVNPDGWTPPLDPLLAAAIENFVLVSPSIAYLVFILM